MKLRIEKAIYGGAGLARADEGPLAGKAVFVPLALPGEVVEARVVDDRRSFANAELESVLEPSAMRTAPGCPYYAQCGGCQYQHAQYEEQLRMKAAILAESLERARVAGVPDLATLAGEPWGYRNRIRLHVEKQPLALGYRERRSHRTLSIGECPIAAPLLERAVVACQALGAELASLCEEIELFTNEAGSALLVSLMASRPARGFEQRLQSVFGTLRGVVPELGGVGYFAAETPRQPARLLAQAGEASLMYRVGEDAYRVSIGSFFQVNRFLVDPLVELVVGGRSGALAWDLYAGVGLFARRLAERFATVVAVESAPSSSADLKANLPRGAHRAMRSVTHDFLRREAKSAARPDLVVVDPPRAGLGADVTRLLAEAAPAEIVYVSCDPATLSRDLHALVQSGYTLKSLHLVDLFPQTFHLESVSVLVRT
jgi:23S rRNA (uracil1939-C5)-methyltransferase